MLFFKNSKNQYQQPTKQSLCPFEAALSETPNYNWDNYQKIVDFQMSSYQRIIE